MRSYPKDDPVYQEGWSIFSPPSGVGSGKLTAELVSPSMTLDEERDLLLRQDLTPEEREKAEAEVDRNYRIRLSTGEPFILPDQEADLLAHMVATRDREGFIRVYKQVMENRRRRLSSKTDSGPSLTHADSPSGSTETVSISSEECPDSKG